MCNGRAPVKIVPTVFMKEQKSAGCFVETARFIVWYCICWVTMPSSNNPDWIDWRNSWAREILLEDLHDGVLPLDEEELSAEDAWNMMYVHMPEFVTIVFDQFKARLKGHRQQVKRAKGAQTSEVDALMHDRSIHPRHPYNKKGEPVFDLSEAKPLLRKDVAEEKHLNMSLDDLWKTRPEYCDFWDKDFFKRRVRQEVRRVKYMYYLEWKRAKQAAKRGRRRTGTDDEENINDDEVESSSDDAMEEIT